MTGSKPILWHITISHYSEKARWALDHKRVEHKRRAVVVPGSHIPVALWMTHGAHATFPVLEIDSRRIGDSSAIIAALEERFPDPPLHPRDPEERRRALELEDYFDEELGPAARLLPFHELGNDPELLRRIIERTSPAALARRSGAASVYARAYTAMRFRVRGDAGADQARQTALAAIDRLEAELGDGEYLVGDSFTVADLTAASLFYPLFVPEGGPLPVDTQLPAGLERFREPLKERRGFKWVSEMFRRHRKPDGRRADAPAPPATAGAE